MFQFGPLFYDFPEQPMLKLIATFFFGVPNISQAISFHRSDLTAESNFMPCDPMMHWGSAERGFLTNVLQV